MSTMLYTELWSNVQTQSQSTKLKTPERFQGVKSRHWLHSKRKKSIFYLTKDQPGSLLVQAFNRQVCCIKERWTEVAIFCFIGPHTRTFSCSCTKCLTSLWEACFYECFKSDSLNSLNCINLSWIACVTLMNTTCSLRGARVRFHNLHKP